jgi:hypothetical protein
MEISKKTKKAGILAATLSVIVIILAGALLAMTEEPIQAGPVFPRDHLSIDASYLLKTGETNDTVNVSCELFMTNSWEKESGDIKAIAYVSEQSTNLAVFKSTVIVGPIKANSTKEINVPVEFTDNSYKVEILFFESDKLVLKATLSINSYQNYYFDCDGMKVYNKGRTPEDAEDDGQWSIEGGVPHIQSIH